MAPILHQVLDLDGYIVGEMRILGVQPGDNGERVADAVEKVRITEGDVLRAGLHLAPNIFQYDLLLDDPEVPVIDRNNRAVPAQVPAAAACFRVADNMRLSAGMIQ